MEDFKSISVTKNKKKLEIDNPTHYQLIGHGSQGAVFKLSENKCVKIYVNPTQAQMEKEALQAGQHLPFIPKLYEFGPTFNVIDYFHAPTLKEYLRNCTYMPESITKKLLFILKKLKEANFTMVDAPLRHIFVLENEELKVIDHVNSFKRNHPVPIKLLRDLKMILLKDSFLSQVKRLDPDTYKEWDEFLSKGNLSLDDISVMSGGSGNAVKFDSIYADSLIGKGHQGAVFRISEDKCAKLYGKVTHAQQEQEVLLKHQDLPFIPKVYETDDQYVVMEYLAGPDLNTYLKKQSELSKDITKQLLAILKTMKASGFKQIDTPLRHIIMTNKGFKMVDHVYSFEREQDRPIELFENLYERNFLDAFLVQVEELDPAIYAEWTKTPIPVGLEKEGNQTTHLNNTKEVEYMGKSKKDKKKKKEKLKINDSNHNELINPTRNKKDELFKALKEIQRASLQKLINETLPKNFQFNVSWKATMNSSDEQKKNDKPKN